MNMNNIGNAIEYVFVFVFVLLLEHISMSMKNGERQIHTHTTSDVGVPFSQIFSHIGTESKINLERYVRSISRKLAIITNTAKIMCNVYLAGGF